jgi:hypothetical protein
VQRQSREEQITLLNKRIANFKSAIKNPNTFEYSIFRSSTPKQDRIREWAKTLERLHDLGEYIQPIDTISSFIAAELKSIGAPHIISYARGILSDKYKDPSKIHKERLFEHEINEIRDAQRREKVKSDELHYKLNQRYRDLLIQDSKLFLLLAKKLETAEFVNKIDPYLLDQHFTAWKQGSKNITQMLDDRSSVMPEKLHMLVYGYMQGTKSHAFSEYVKILLHTITITPKQTVRLLTGRVTKVESLYEPENQFEARHKGFHGEPCDECGSWRVDVKYNTDKNRNQSFCYSCKEWSEVKVGELMEKEI